MLMKKVLVAGLLLSSASVYAQSCPVDVQNEIHIDGEQVSVYQEGQPKMLIDENNQVYINGKKVDLDAMQQRAVAAYSHGVKEYLPKMADIANDGVGIAGDILNEVSSSFDSKASFAKVEALIGEYGQKAHDKFYQNGEFVMPADMFQTVDTDWKQEFDQAMKHVSVESMSGLFAALSQEMKDGEINFTELQKKFSEMKARIEEKVRARSGEVSEKANELCDSIQGLAQEEKELHRTIPELKNYQMFEI
ncbi:Methyl-accepting chemotaxis protein [Photobacterium marinum]|uniref:Methyl-accepting chemotaxis protein n=1 Tax=Photobacterium marinum TaxID=1056511 RepID=L8J7K8_9GAMM|nr:YggN family protein [Photobacterium marinum]ELR64830.1 Methyl-accepting chemotaxis protein [Photobacterium marinum]